MKLGCWQLRTGAPTRISNQISIDVIHNLHLDQFYFCWSLLIYTNNRMLPYVHREFKLGYKYDRDLYNII